MRLLADRLLHHYAATSGARAKHFRARSRTAVAACIRDMEGTDAAKEMRLRGVIDDAIAASRARGITHPPIAFVFNVTHVRRRLERLAEADHLARKAAEAETAVAVLEMVRAANDDHAAKGLGATPRTTRRDPLAKTGHAARKMPQDAPASGTVPKGGPSFLTSPGGISSAEEALRMLMALGGDSDGAPVGVGSPTAVLSAEERAALEGAQAAARARWARAG